MKYDDASWHYGGDFPPDLPRAAGATHIAMFVAWCVLNGLGNPDQAAELEEELTNLKARQITPTNWFIQACDEKFTDEDLSEEGNRFATQYYGGPDGLCSGPRSYVADYTQAFPETPKLYGVADTWENFDRIAPFISRRAREWRTRPKSRWWPF